MELEPKITVCSCGATFSRTGKQKSCSVVCWRRQYAKAEYKMYKDNPTRKCVDCNKTVEPKNKGKRCYKCKYDYQKARLTPEQWESMYGSTYQNKKRKDREYRKEQALSEDKCRAWIKEIEERGAMVSIYEVFVTLQDVAESIGCHSTVDYLEPSQYYMFLWQYCLAWSKTDGSKRNRVKLTNIKKQLGIL